MALSCDKIFQCFLQAFITLFVRQLPGSGFRTFNKPITSSYWAYMPKASPIRSVFSVWMSRYERKGVEFKPIGTIFYLKTVALC